MHGMGEYFGQNGLGASAMAVPASVRAAVARRKAAPVAAYYNRCIAAHASSPNRAAKCQESARLWAREHGLAGMGEYFSGVGTDDNLHFPGDPHERVAFGLGAVLGIGLGYFLFRKK